MNFRCDLTNFSAKELARHNDVRGLVAADQLLVAKTTDELLYRFHEEEITFLPTFKYDKHSEEYDTSKKQRTPSYTDRVLFSVNEGNMSGNQHDFKAPGAQRQNGNQVYVDYYNRRESTFSDHRPVLLLLNMRVRKINY